MKLIPVYYHGQVVGETLVDDGDYDELTQHCWSLSKNGYVQRGYRVGGEPGTQLMHRQILGLTPGDGVEVDHCNRDPLDNRRTNLQAVPRGLNMQNRGSHKDATSTYRGVCWVSRDQVWLTEICLDHVRYTFGSYVDEHTAATVACAARMLTMKHALEPVQELSQWAADIGVTPEQWLHYLEKTVPNWGTRKASSAPMPVLDAWRAAAV